MLEVKETTYKGMHNANPLGRVGYVVVGREIIFSGLSLLPTASTIQAGENIIKAICDAEGILWNEYTFYDIQTSRGYSRKSVGEYDIDRLILQEGQLQIDGWEPIQVHMLPDGVFELFHTYIYEPVTTKTDVVTAEPDQWDWSTTEIGIALNALKTLSNVVDAIAKEATGAIQNLFRCESLLIRAMVLMVETVLGSSFEHHPSSYVISVLYQAVGWIGLEFTIKGKKVSIRPDVTAIDKTPYDVQETPLVSLSLFTGKEWTQNHLQVFLELLHRIQEVFAVAAARTGDSHTHIKEVLNRVELIFRVCIIIARSATENEDVRTHRSYIGSKLKNALYGYGVEITEID